MNIKSIPIRRAVRLTRYNGVVNLQLLWALSVHLCAAHRTGSCAALRFTCPAELCGDGARPR